MRTLITGGAGFVGSHLAQQLLQQGHDVTIVDELNDFYAPALKQRNLAEIRASGTVSFVQADICSSEEMVRVVQTAKPDVIYHLAARAGIRPSLGDPLLYERVNVHGTLSLLEASRQAKVPTFVFASSSSVYGNSRDAQFSESSSCTLPISPYAATKLAGEQLCHTYSHLYGIKTICLRLFTVYGPRQRPDLAIRKFSEKILEGSPLPVFGDGSSARDYTYISDIVDGLLAAPECPSRFEVFNLGNSTPVVLSEVISTIETALGREAKINRLPLQPGDVSSTCADISKAGATLGYRPQVSFSEGIRRFVAWLRDQENSRHPTQRPQPESEASHPQRNDVLIG